MHVTANRANLLGILVLGGVEGAVGVHLYPLHSLWLRLWLQPTASIAFTKCTA